MTTQEIVRSWRDDEYRASLNSNDLALVPENPVGLLELSDQELAGTDAGTLSTISIASTIVIIISHEASCSWGGDGCMTIDFAGGKCIG